MYGINGLDNEEDFKKILDFNLPEAIQQENYHAQDIPEIAHGLLGGVNEQNNTPKLSGSTANMAAQMGQMAQALAKSGNPDDGTAQQQHVQGQQVLAQQQQQQQQQQQAVMQTVMNLLIKYFTGGFG